MAEHPNAIEVRNVHKTFRIPIQRITTLRERALHPTRRQEYRELHVLDDLSFDIGHGEFFGIVGRNGSGKSTLLKLIASIYGTDAGTIRVAGRVAPFIELGVGFHPEQTAYDNVVLNGVMMGLTPREARERFDAVIEFAELEEFTELKLKNYSSGMRVRLGFAVMVQVDADVLLIDEVLAVGDAAFQEKCSETFRELRSRGKTIVLVTHSMGYVRQYCDRALLLEDGSIDRIGDADDVVARYTELNMARAAAPRRPAAEAGTGPRGARIVDAWLEHAGGERSRRVPRDQPIEFRAELEAEEELEGARFGFELWNAAGARIFAPEPTLLPDEGRVEAGERLRVRGAIENRLTPGRYRLNCAVFGLGADGEEAPISEVRGVPFQVPGRKSRAGLTELRCEVSVEREAQPAEVVRR